MSKSEVMKRTRGSKIKYPILPDNLESVDIKNRGKQLKRYDGTTLQGLSWKEFQEYVGKDLNLNERFYYKFAFRDGTWNSGSTQAINNSVKPEKDMSDNKEMLKMFEAFEKKLSSAATQGGVSVEMLLLSTKQGYEAQVSYLKTRIDEKDITITELKAEIKDLEDELDEADKKLIELEGKSGWVGILNQYKPMIEAGLMKLGAKGPHPAKLGESDPSGIPAEVLEILGTVDYDKLKTQPDQYNQILNYLRQYVSVLPQKGKD
jgi:hypothetical protein